MMRSLMQVTSTFMIVDCLSNGIQTDIMARKVGGPFCDHKSLVAKHATCGSSSSTCHSFHSSLHTISWLTYTISDLIHGGRGGAGASR